MSSKARKNELQRQNELAYDREYAERQAREVAAETRFGKLRRRLEDLGIDGDLLAKYVVYLAQEYASYQTMA